MKLINRLKKNNKGYSLIEVIVAMLILAIIAVPLLNSLGMTTRVNLDNRDKQYASNVATNIMEAVKQFGISETALQMHEKTTFKYANATSFGESLKDFDTKIVFGDDETVPAAIAKISATQYKFMPRPNYTDEDYKRKYYFYINDIEEGTKKFDAHITFDATTAAYQSTENKLNNYKLADFSSLNSTRTALIAPSGVWFTTKLIDSNESYDISKTFESEALRVFQERYSEYMNRLLAEEKTKRSNTNELAYTAVRTYIAQATNPLDNVFANYFLDNSTSRTKRETAYNFYKNNYHDAYIAYVTEYQTYDLTADYIPTDVNAIVAQDSLGIKNMDKSQRDAKFIGMIARKTAITIKQETNDLGQVVYVVSSSTIFTFDQGNNSYLADKNDADAVAEQTVYECKGYYENMAFKGLENFYLFQDGARASNYKSDSILLDFTALGDNKILGYNLEPAEKISFYSVWQYLKAVGDEVVEDTTAAYTNRVDIYLKGNEDIAKQFVFYVGEKPVYKLYRIPEGATEETALDWDNHDKGTLIADLDNTDRAYTVTVDICAAGTDDVLYTLSTVIKE